MQDQVNAARAGKRAQVVPGLSQKRPQNTNQQVLSNRYNDFYKSDWSVQRLNSPQ